MVSNKAPINAIRKLLSLRVSTGEIEQAGVELFQYLYGCPGVPLQQQRFERYSSTVAKGNFRPEKLPPTSDAAAQHSLRTNLQYHDWSLSHCLKAKA